VSAVLCVCRFVICRFVCASCTVFAVQYMTGGGAVLYIVLLLYGQR
jgi:hypothetical protein